MSCLAPQENGDRHPPPGQLTCGGECRQVPNAPRGCRGGDTAAGLDVGQRTAIPPAGRTTPGLPGPGHREPADVGTYVPTVAMSLPQQLSSVPSGIQAQKMTPNDDPEAYLNAFDRTAIAVGWPAQQWSARLIPCPASGRHAAVIGLTRHP